MVERQLILSLSLFRDYGTIYLPRVLGSSPITQVPPLPTLLNVPSPLLSPFPYAELLPLKKKKKSLFSIYHRVL